jgi:hypothetical protein
VKWTLFWLFSLLFLLSFSPRVSAQSLFNVSATIDNVNGSITVNYDLVSGLRSKRFKVDIYCSLDSGKSFSEALVGVSKDVGYNIKPGPGKQANWAYFIDMPEFSGKNVVFKVSAKEDIEYKENIILSLGGPEKFYQSIVLPGYGNYHVRNGKGYMIVAGLVYSMLGAGTYLHFESKNSYAAYKKSTTVETAKRNFNRADSYRSTSNILLAGGFAIWSVDIGQVILKGISNRKKQKQILQKRQK